MHLQEPNLLNPSLLPSLLISDGNADMDIDQMELDDVSVLAFLSETNCVGEVYSPPRVVPYC